MKRAGFSAKAGQQVSEMAIVDTFTRLIFGPGGEFSPQQLAVIQALRLADDNVECGTPRDIGAYLQALGEREMVELVGRVHARLTSGLSAAASGMDCPAH